MRKQTVGAFVTIEYTLLIPVLLFLYTFLIYMGLFLHNRCVLQANAYLLGVEGSHLTVTDPAEKVARLQEKERQLYHKYILAEELSCTYQVRGNYIYISSNGQMVNPFSLAGIGADIWSLNADCQTITISPADTLRLCKAGRNFLKGLSDKEEHSSE